MKRMVAYLIGVIVELGFVGGLILIGLLISLVVYMVSGT